ncbi:MAG: hypothetical protein AAF515_05590 [Pseudomonadota bacterium]
MHRLSSFAVALCCALMLNGPSLAEEASADTPRPPAIGGYSPVSYFTVGKPQLGSPEFAVQHEGRTYYLTSAEQAEVFSADPARYAPAFPLCPYSLATGGRAQIDPTNFKVAGEHLLLFHRSTAGDGLAKFEASGLSDAELIESARGQLKLLKF